MSLADRKLGSQLKVDGRAVVIRLFEEATQDQWYEDVRTAVEALGVTYFLTATYRIRDEGVTASPYDDMSAGSGSDDDEGDEA